MHKEDEMLTGKVVSQTAGEPLRCLCQLHQGTMQGHAIALGTFCCRTFLCPASCIS